MNKKEDILEVVRHIPRGSTLSYKQVAEKAGLPRGHRYVARIMSLNTDKTVPCHRVIRSNGTLGGYNRGGSSKKRLLLLAEGALT